MERLTWVSEPQGMTVWELGDIEIGFEAHHALEEERVFPIFSILRRCLAHKYPGIAW